MPARHPLDERAVERCVMGKHRRAGYEVGKLGHRLPRARRSRNIQVRNVGECLDVLGDGHTGVHERSERVDDLAPTQANGGYLGQLALGEGQPRRLCVENDHVILDEAKLLGPCALGE